MKIDLRQIATMKANSSNLLIKAKLRVKTNNRKMEHPLLRLDDFAFKKGKLSPPKTTVTSPLRSTKGTLSQKYNLFIFHYCY